MQVPFHNVFHNNLRFSPSNMQWRPNFAPRGNRARFRAPAQHWRQPSPQEYANEFWCETCDRGFRTPDILEKHKQQHQKCNIDGCQFIAHPKVITKHIQMQHASGLYKKIAKLQDPEEIRKWREERKKKYPTKENVEKAAAAIKEKIDRGEKMGLKNKRHEKNFNTDSGIGGKKKSFNKRHGTNNSDQNSAPDGKRKKRFCKTMAMFSLPEIEDVRKLRPFTGIQELMMDADEPQDELECDFNIEDEDDLENIEIPSNTTTGPVCLALSSLMCNYGSSDEDESNNSPIIPMNVSSTTKVINESKVGPASTSNEATVNNEILETKNKNKEPSQMGNESDNDGPEEVKVTKQINESELSEIKGGNRRKPKNKIPQKPVFKRPKPKLPSTLLQKLLCKEMKHERNVVLQCIRYIIKNNFFEKSV